MKIMKSNIISAVIVVSLLIASISVNSQVIVKDTIYPDKDATISLLNFYTNYGNSETFNSYFIAVHLK